MKASATRIPDVLILEPQVFGDARGFFYESYNRKRFEEAVGQRVEFVQDNHSRSARGVLRGLHYQLRQTQAKLVRVIEGEIYDVAVDLRRDSPTFGQWVGAYLDAESKRQIWIPKGFAHGFYVCSEFAQVLYKADNYYAPADERCILWNDADLGIEWPVQDEPLLSDKDRNGLVFRAAEYL